MHDDEPLHQHASDPPPLAPALDDPPQAPRPFPEEEHRAPGAHRSRGTGTLVLTLGALGVVYGDIGTSPLYAMREAFHGAHGLALTAANILGVASLAVWSLILMISLKYVTFILRADNHGEGGTLALLGLIPPRLSRGLPTRPLPLVIVLLFGSALLLGDGVVTPAISVLSAVEGVGVSQDRVVTLTAVILAALFLVQRFGTARVGGVFGPVMLVWFVVIGLLGAAHVVASPAILAALDPRHGLRLLSSGQPGSYLVLGAVVLCVSGGEALYADLGHFGRRPIQLAWYRLVLPALLLNYLGQAALLLRSPEAIANPFYAMAPSVLRYPLVALATAATVIASQALISGCFSLARQAVHLGFLPRITTEHTSSSESGQIYVPFVNGLMMLLCLALVLGFRSSSALAGAYGLSVTGTMMATSIGFFVVMRRVWGMRLLTAGAVAGVFLVIDGAFLGANLVKIADGGWVPLSIALALLACTLIWRDGRRRLATLTKRRTISVDAFLDRTDVQSARRVPGTGVFLTSGTTGVPPTLAHHLERVGILHREVVLLTVQTLDVPFVQPSHRLRVTELGRGLHRVVASFGYQETPDVPALLEACAVHGLVVDFERVTYFLGRDVHRLRRRHGPLSIPRRLFAFMARNAAPAVGYFAMPPERVVEIGLQYEM